MTDPKFEQPDDDDERTTVVDRSGSVENDEGNETVVVDRTGRSALVADDEHEGTVVVDRSAAAIEDVHDGTVVVDRSAVAVDDEHDGAVVVDRSAPAADEHDGTVVVDRSAPTSGTHDGTVVVPRPASEKSKSASRPADSPRRGRRRITLPPVEPGFGPDPVDAVGVGAVDAYQPRSIEPAPALAPQIPLGADATRAPAPSMPSVRRRSGTFGAIAIGGFALACVISVVGLVLIVTALFS